ncbi:putative cell division cycle ATPase [Harmonia axyridis]|uniref:putative cell division cycle ATPase n=1 Tax=Harmonia axyridis TaxID=115357 RepID=UPI001E27842A|nr:putative cell division cycle ATPase [Harmonia axyridis]
MSDGGDCEGDRDVRNFLEFKWMEQYPGTHRAFCVREYYRNGDSIVASQVSTFISVPHLIKISSQFVFLSQSCMQICDLAISSWTVLKINDLAPIVKRVRPTTGKSLTSVHLTKKVLDLYFGDVKAYPTVYVTKLTQDTKEALVITLKSIGSPKTTETTSEIEKELCYIFKRTILTNGNKISIVHFGRFWKSRNRESLKKMFEALSNAPTIMVFDNLDQICSKCSKSTVEQKLFLLEDLLTHLDKLNNNRGVKVFVIGITNNISNVAPELRKPGTFDHEINIPVPEPAARKELFEEISEIYEHDITEDELFEISKATRGFVGEDLVKLCLTAKFL